jgi:diguanylate cyclase (GGDEF)-like protein
MPVDQFIQMQPPGMRLPHRQAGLNGVVCREKSGWSKDFFRKSQQTGLPCAMAEAAQPKQRILVQVERRQERRLIEEWLARTYEIVSTERVSDLEMQFDLAIIDGRSLKRLHSKVKARRNAEEPVLLPFLLLTVRRLGTFPARHLGKLVDDVVIRPLNRDELQARVANLLRLRKFSQDLKREHDRVVRLTVTDDVSGFHNTRYLHRYLDRLLDSPRAREEEVSLVFFDMDNFKQVVDTHGHLLGSKVLREVAQTVGRVLDQDDRLVRYGGDEFIVILPRQSKERALTKVERIREAIQTTRFLDKEGINVRLSASFGLAGFPDDAQDKRGLLAEADRCLFESKSEGKNQITMAGGPEEVEEEVPMEPELEELVAAR